MVNKVKPTLFSLGKLTQVLPVTLYKEVSPIVADTVLDNKCIMVDGVTGAGKTTMLAYLIQHTLKNHKVYVLRTRTEELEGMVKSQEVDNISFVTNSFLGKLSKIPSTENNQVVVIDDYFHLNNESDIEGVVKDLYKSGYKIIIADYSAYIKEKESLLTVMGGHVQITVNKRTPNGINEVVEHKEGYRTELYNEPQG